MESLCKGTAADREDMIDFGNYVFSCAHAPHDFVKLVPRLYAEGQNKEQYHYLIKENERIKAMICALPITLGAGEKRLQGNYIGTVSVHPYARGKNYMKRLMAEAIGEMKERGDVFSALSGQRQRYGYFGYEYGGTQYQFTVTDANIRHCCREIDRTIEFRPIMEQDEELISRVYEIYNALPLKGIRSREEFHIMLCSWQSVPCAIFEKEVLLGYVVLGGTTLHELVLEDEEDLVPVLKGLIEGKKLPRVSMMTSMDEGQRIGLLAEICDSCQVTDNHSYQIFDYRTFIDVLLSYQAERKRLPDGKAAFKIADRTVAVEVKDNIVTVTEEATAADFILLTDKEAVAFLTSPVSAKRTQWEAEKPFLKFWFPLPLFISSLDAC